MIPIFVVTPAWLAGIFIAGWLGIANIWLIIGAAGGLGLLLYAYVANRRQKQHQAQSYLSPLLPMLLLAFCLGGLRLNWDTPSITPDNLQYYASDEPLKIVGVISNEPTYTERSGSYRLSVRQLYPSPETRQGVNLSGDVFIRTNNIYRYEAGDLLELTGKLELPQEITGDGFPYRDYLDRQGIHVSMSYPRARLLDTRQQFFVLQLLGDVRRSARQQIQNFVPGEEGDLLAGILLGDQRDIDPETKEAFRRTSTSHIVAISGANISITITLVVLLLVDFLKLKRRRALIIVLVIITAYVIMVGASPSVVRAGLMGGFMIIGWILGREYAALTGLCGAALLMTLFQPRTLWDIGFQLSFLATLGLVLIAQPMQDHRWFKDLPPFLQEGVILTLAATITTLPLTMFYFTQISTVFLLANVLVVPALAAVMITGALAVVAGWLFGGWLPIMATAFSWVAWLFLAYMLRVVKLFADLPFASFLIPPIHPIWLIYYYVGLGLWLWYKRDDSGRMRQKLQQLATSPLALGSLISLNLAIWAVVLLL